VFGIRMNVFKLFGILTLFLLGGSLVNAAEIDFSDGAGNDLTTFQQVIQGTGPSAGAVATFQNPLVDAGTNDFFNLENGLALGTGGLGSSWEVVFDRDVDLYSYTIDFSSGNIPFDITGMGVNLTGLSNAQGTVTPATPITFLANEVYTFAIQPTIEFGGLTFLTWTFDPAAPVGAATPVPALSPIGLVLLIMIFGGLGFIGFSRPFSN
jgi:hypothetical protein